MLKRYNHTVGGIFRFVDACVIGVVWLVSYWLRFHLPLIEVTKGFPAFRTYAALSPLVIILWATVLSSFKLYQSSRMLRRTHEAHLILRAHFVAMLFFIALTYLFSEYRYSRGVMLYFGILGGFLLVFVRLTLRNTLRDLRRRGFNLRYVLAVGEGGAIETLIQRLAKFPELGLKVIGILTHEKSATTAIAGIQVIGHFNDINEMIRRTQANKVFIALPRDQFGDLDRILSSIRDETVDVQLVPDVHEYITLGCEIEDFDGLPVVNLNDSPLDGWGSLAKRATDMIVAGLALVLLSPVLFFIGLAVKLTSRGPIFFEQERMGMDGKTFKMLKFRSMRTDAEEKTGAVWAKPNDDRRTPIGAVLRATSLDELPQLWNIMRGDMSLVGPRPERPVFVSQFRHEIPHYMLRHKVKAGLTGWAQVNGWRGDTSLSKRIECDLFYIRNWSYFFDLKIIALTFWRGFINKNAY